MSIPGYVFRQTLRELFAPIAPYLEDEEVSEVLINAHDEIYVERHGILELTDSKFASDDALLSALRNLSQYVGRHLGGQKPILEARLPDGSRVEAIIPPASPRGPTACIRCFPQRLLTLDKLLELNSISPRTGEILSALVRERRNLVVGGGSGTGKTSLLNALASLARPTERVIVIEDSKELQLALPHVVHLEAQPADARGNGGITIRELVRATLRMRPDRIVIGEIRGGEALDLVQAMTSGHRGCISTVHGALPLDTLGRLETMALMSDVEIPVSVLRAQIASAIDVIVHVARSETGMRRVTHVVEVLGTDARGEYRLRSLVEPEVQ